MPQHYTFLKNETSIAITRDAQTKHETVSSILRKLAEEKYRSKKA